MPLGHKDVSMQSCVSTYSLTEFEKVQESNRKLVAGTYLAVDFVQQASPIVVLQHI